MLVSTSARAAAVTTVGFGGRGVHERRSTPRGRDLRAAFAPTPRPIASGAVDLTLTAPEQALADECRSWLRANLPWEYGRGRPPRFDDLEAEVAFGREWQASLREGRWVGVAWPPEYGGRGAGPLGGHNVTAGLGRPHAPPPVR